MLSVVASLRRGRSAKSKLESGLSANFKERKPKAKAKPPAPPANVVPHGRKPKLVKMKNLQVEYVTHARPKRGRKLGKIL